MTRIPESELIINNDGSIFHLHMKPEELADKVILVGDPGRVETVASFFDKIEARAENREFRFCTGFFQGKRISVLSTGIGTDNIDIVINELDALANIDFETRTIREHKRSLEIVRIGTSGGLQEDIKVDSWLLSKISIGFDGLLNFYANRSTVHMQAFEDAFKKHVNWSEFLTSPYVVAASKKLIERLRSEELREGVTISAPGFYGPQGRVLRLPLQNPNINDKIETFEFEGNTIANYEMESSAIAGLSALLGHEAVTVCAIIANRVSKTYSKDYKSTVKRLIKYVLEKL